MIGLKFCLPPGRTAAKRAFIEHTIYNNDFCFALASLRFRG
jgi:hypothetical protein